MLRRFFLLFVAFILLISCHEKKSVIDDDLNNPADSQVVTLFVDTNYR